MAEHTMATRSPSCCSIALGEAFGGRSKLISRRASWSLTSSEPSCLGPCPMRCRPLLIVGHGLREAHYQHMARAAEQVSSFPHDGSKLLMRSCMHGAGMSRLNVRAACIFAP